MTAFKAIFIFLLFLSVNLNASTARISTYNIWNPVFEEKYSGKSTWAQRLPFIIKNINSSNSDIICLEEVGKTEYLDLIQDPEIHTNFISFYISHAGSKPGQKEGRDGLALLYNPEKVSVLKLVQSTDGARPTHRRDVYVDFQVKEKSEDQVRFRVACTHLDSDKDLTIGNAQLAVLVKEVLKLNAEEKIDFIAVCGDFNEGAEEEHRPRFEIMSDHGFETDGSTLPTRPEALNVRHNGHVDWIYFKNISGLKYKLASEQPIGDERASDHKLTSTEIQWR